ncbi:decapping and exoribonuclease protein [Rhinophrynus dorsalis]
MDLNKHNSKDNGAKPLKRSSDLDFSTAPLSKRPLTSPSSLKILPSLYQGAFPFYRLPSEVGHFSLDEKRNYHGDARRLRYFCPPKGADGRRASLDWDVMDGYETHYVRKDEEEKEGLLHILTWLKENRRKLGGSKRPVERDFVTWRGHLTKILCTPYENQEGWQLAVSLFRGTLYISERETAEARKKREERSNQMDRLLYSGFKFESYMCSDSPESLPSSSEVVNTNEAFCSVLLARLASHSLLISGEVDCTNPSAPSAVPPSCYVELKTSGQIRNPHQQRSFNRYKLIKWWSQSFLLGIPLIVAGFRSPEGRIVSLENYRTSDIPRLVRDDRNSWDPAVCMNFCNAFLSYVKRVVTKDDPLLVYLFSWKPGSDITFTVHTDPDYIILPHWYVEDISR